PNGGADGSDEGFPSGATKDPGADPVPAADIESQVLIQGPVVNDLNSALLRVLVAALAGGLIGVERERNQHERSEVTFAGARTFPLIAILGASRTLASG